MFRSATVTKYACLAFLTFQNACLVLTLRYSRTLPGPRYLTSTAVLLSEVCKCLISLGLYGWFGMKAVRNERQQERSPDEKVEEDNTASSSSFPPLLPTTRKEILAFLPVLVPAFLYTIQNNLQFIAISNLDVATFQVAYQGKILTTAICAVIFLGKRLSRTQIASVCLLAVGVGLASASTRGGSAAVQTTAHKQYPGRGILATGGACLLSGFAGVYIEMILKTTQKRRDTGLDPAVRFWYCNYQLALASLLFALPTVVVQDYQAIVQNGFLTGYNPVVWMSIFQQAAGGLAVSLVVTFADNILKGFATSISMIISTFVSAVVWKTKLSGLFTVGMVAVLSASHIYAYAESTAGSRTYVPDVEEVERILSDDNEKIDPII